MPLTIERFGEKMVELLPQMLRGFARRESNYLSRGKITIPQLSVLELLSRERDCPMNRIAEILGVTRPAATGLADRLIAQGLALRHGDPKDRRVIRVNLTPKGRRVLANIWDQKRRMIVSVFGRISPARREQYLSTLEQVVRILGLVLLLVFVGSAFAEPPHGLTLAEAYRLALKRSEEVAVRAELITETEGRFQQALSGILPKLFFHSTDKRQDDSAGGSSAFTRRNLPERKFTLTQPLFSGFKEFAAMRGSKSEKRLRESEKARAEQLLLVDVSDAFHLLIAQREELEALNATRRTLQERLKELEEREKIGRSRLSELVAARSQLYRVEADWEEAQATERVTSELLKFLTGLSAIGDLADPGPALPDPLAEESYAALAHLQPAVQAAEQTAEIARQELRVARATFFPTADLEGNYYAERSGAAEEVKWDASLNVDVPLFQGGKAVGAAKEAESVLRQSELRLQEARRTAHQEILDDRTEYEGAVARVRALTKALEATEESYRMQAEEYRLNLVSNLDVLDALQLLQDSRRSLIQALQEAHRLYWKLQSHSPETMSSLRS